jgi:trehalose/maltose hydrolase-like predicted phosphorylase
MISNNFKILHEGYNQSGELLRETLNTLGNGYFATRGAHESSKAGISHYPGTYLAGGYNRLESIVNNEIIINEDIVNWPNWLFLTFKIDNGDWISIDDIFMRSYKQTLDLKHGILELSMYFVDNYNRETTIISQRLVHMNDPHIAAISWKLTPHNWSGPITIHSALDGKITNSGVKRYRTLNGNHLEALHFGKASEDSVFLEVRTKQSNIHMVQAIRTLVYNEDDMPVPVQRTTIEQEGYVAQELTYTITQGHPSLIEKIAAIYTSRDRAISDPFTEAKNALLHAARFDELKQTHLWAWVELWNRFDIKITDDEKTQQLLRLHIFHILQVASANIYDLDAGIPPRGLHGEAYRGHILWDELFVFPFLTLRMPLLTRDFLLYRFRRLNQARLAAKKAGYRGAMYPWQSGSNGREESQHIHLNPRSNRWVPDETYLQRHVSAAIAYNIWQYFQITDDKEFLYFFGAEILFEIAKFWASFARYNAARKRFEIHGVIGPDEYHTRYPDSNESGINNNAYTNIMAAWVLMRALEVIDILDKKRKDELTYNLNIDSEELDRWSNISSKMYIPLKSGIIEQFEGYCNLKELDWEKYHSRYGENVRLDRILESENDSVNNYQAGKQADVLMLFYLFSSEEIKETFAHMGYDFDPNSIPCNLEYYRNRTSHGSTLSRLVFSWVLSRSNRAQSWHVYSKALISDFEDVQGGTTQEGIHLGAMAGTVDMIQRCYTGLEVKNNVLRFDPQLPEHIKEITMNFRYRSHWMEIVVNHQTLKIDFERGWGNPVHIRVGDSTYEFSEKITRIFEI